jgi:dihydrofolate reductase
MRKVIYQAMVSVDGYFEGLKQEIDWHVVDQEFNDYVAEMFSSADTLLFGRVTYELMSSFWPTPAALADDPVTAKWMNSLQKVVFSRTLEKVEWQNSRLVKTDPVEEIRRLKQQPGKDMGVGGSNLALTLIPAGVIDEYRILVAPVILGAGRPLFGGLAHRLHLKLRKTKTFGSGVAVLIYEPAQ